MPEKNEAMLLLEERRRPARAKTARIQRSGPTGPRSQRGKKRSRYNALKHGIFAVALLPVESRRRHEALLQGLIDHLQPVGQLEELLVEKLAMLFWRYRRLMRAEAALVTNAAREIGEELERQARTVWTGDEVGLAHKAYHKDDPFATVPLVERFKELRGRVEEGGLDWDRDQELLIDICGYQYSWKGIEPRPSRFVKKYRELTRRENREEAEVGEVVKSRAANGGEEIHTSSEAKKQMLDMIADHLEFFEDEVHPALLRKVEGMRLSALAALVPRGEIGDRLQRYEGSLERAIDRTLSQLERLQRLRAGQLLPPPVRVEVAGG